MAKMAKAEGEDDCSAKDTLKEAELLSSQTVQAVLLPKAKLNALKLKKRSQAKTNERKKIVAMAGIDAPPRPDVVRHTRPRRVRENVKTSSPPFLPSFLPQFQSSPRALPHTFDIVELADSTIQHVSIMPSRKLKFREVSEYRYN